MPGFVRVGVGVLVKDPKQPNKFIMNIGYVTLFFGTLCCIHLIRNQVFQIQIFAGIRKGSHGAKTLALPGGHLEMNETWEQCAKREVREETGLEIHKVEMLHVSNDIMAEEHKHYITIFMKGECVDPDGEAKNLEPHKCEGWESYSWEDLLNIMNNGRRLQNKNEAISSLFIPLENLVKAEPEKVKQFFER